MAKRYLWEETGEFEPEQNFAPVVITDVRIPFTSMVVLMVKWAVASVPALIILGFAVAIVVGLLLAWVDLARKFGIG